MTCKDNYQLVDETTYDQEFKTYHFNKYQSCECYSCNDYAKVNLKHVFMYGFLIPFLWWFIIASYIYKYYLSSYCNDGPKLSENITELTQYELEQFKNTYFNASSTENKNQSNDNHSILTNQSLTDYQEIYIKECVRDVFMYHEKVQREYATWGWRSFSAIMVYNGILFMIAMFATSSTSYTIVMK